MSIKKVIDKLAAKADKATIVAKLEEYLPKFGITTDEAIAMFIAQCAVESGGFAVVIENLNYSASGLMATWPKRFPTQAIANAYARKPQLIANKVYANRIGNGDELSGDGWRYRGRGFIQLTGSGNYEAFRDYIIANIGGSIGNMLKTHPDSLYAFLEGTDGALLSALWYWTKNNPTGKSLSLLKGDVKKVTKAINGGTHGLEQRGANYKIALETYKEKV